ncbi:MAG TPA: hypothetical protein VK816_01100 [Jatrophihabitantaceae bacterium]|jgi:hypothetical protein|nr:hypothetical protein [Jatrophihabitantaceae bacterium]
MFNLAFIPDKRAAVGLTMVIVGTCLIGYGLVLAAVVATSSATRGLTPEQHGLSAGLITSSQQWGLGAGLAVLTNVSRIGLPSIGEGPRAAFLGGAIAAAAGATGIWSTLSRHRKTWLR